MSAVLAGQPGWARQTPVPASGLTPVTTQALIEAVSRSYDQLFDEAARLEFSAHEIVRMREFFKESEKYCTGNFERGAKEQEREIQQAQAELSRLPKDTAGEARKTIQCRIQTARLRKAHAELLARRAVPVAYQNRQAKLQLIEAWPAELTRIKAAMAAGTHLGRKHGDVLDIGFREIEKDQEKDVKRGKDAIDEMKMAGILPKEITDSHVKAYTEALAVKIASKSDLRVPVKVFVLDSPEVNAFALPGGFLFIHAGLLDAVEDEAQLAGVIAHEIAHATARHGHKLMRRATIASIIYQAIQIAAAIAVGPVGIGAYYALQYGFYGLGLILSLDLLGVSRDFEIEADQLGVQYAWNAGYDPSGFVRFFDRMATREGYAQGVSWFRTHPPFYERMVDSRRESMYLPAKPSLEVTTMAFAEMKGHLDPLVRQSKNQRKPSLVLAEPDCPRPKFEGAEPGVRIETLCEIPLPEAAGK
jgi:Zn-dependent protease with chaperone function